jgi:hypothetical protein
VELDAGGGRAVGIQRDEDLDHAIVSSRLRHDLQQEADAVAIDEELFFVEVGDVGQPTGKLVCRRLVLPAQAEEAREAFGGTFLAEQACAQCGQHVCSRCRCSVARRGGGPRLEGTQSLGDRRSVLGGGLALLQLLRMGPCVGVPGVR